jgi:hypothetical protein
LTSGNDEFKTYTSLLLDVKAYYALFFLTIVVQDRRGFFKNFNLNLEKLICKINVINNSFKKLPFYFVFK